MGLGSAIKKAVKKVGRIVKDAGKVVTSSIKNAINPVKAIKNIADNPMMGLVKLTGMDALIKPGNPGTGQVQGYPYNDASLDDKNAPQDRARHLNRQGEAAVQPNLLLGQGIDFEGLRLDRDQELGEK